MDVGIMELAKKTIEDFGKMIRVFQGGNVTKCSLTIMDVNIE